MMGGELITWRTASSLKTDPRVFVTRTEYTAASEKAMLLSVKIAESEPETLPPSVRSTPFLRQRHAKVGAPLARTLKLTVAPEYSVMFEGCRAICGAVVMARRKMTPLSPGPPFWVEP